MLKFKKTYWEETMSNKAGEANAMVLSWIKLVIEKLMLFNSSNCQVSMAWELFDTSKDLAIPRIWNWKELASFQGIASLLLEVAISFGNGTPKVIPAPNTELEMRALYPKLSPFPNDISVLQRFLISNELICTSNVLCKKFSRIQLVYEKCDDLNVEVCPFT